MFTTIDSVRVGFDIEDERHFTTLFTSAIQVALPLVQFAGFTQFEFGALRPFEMALGTPTFHAEADFIGA